MCTPQPSEHSDIIFCRTHCIGTELKPLCACSSVSCHEFVAQPQILGWVEEREEDRRKE